MSLLFFFTINGVELFVDVAQLREAASVTHEPSLIHDKDLVGLNKKAKNISLALVDGAGKEKYRVDPSMLEDFPWKRIGEAAG
mmetsp:Transcript_7270/g.18908  ORF Transcript_7270/g.18908 Transcript_7270/m.18908 type:complete len:83 (-) Transcript_7270:3157-3405(-)